MAAEVTVVTVAVETEAEAVVDAAVVVGVCTTETVGIAVGRAEESEEDDAVEPADEFVKPDEKVELVELEEGLLLPDAAALPVAAGTVTDNFEPAGLLNIVET